MNETTTSTTAEEVAVAAPTALPDIKTITEQAKAAVPVRARAVDDAKRAETKAIEARRKAEDDLKEAERLVRALSGSPLKGTTRKPAAKPA